MNLSYFLRACVFVCVGCGGGGGGGVVVQGGCIFVWIPRENFCIVHEILATQSENRVFILV